MARGVSPDDTAAIGRIEKSLRDYAEAIGPWARAHAQRMLEDVSRRDAAVWADLAKDMSRALRQEIKEAPTGELLRGLLDEQVELIKSLPLEAAKRIQHFVLEGMLGGIRPETVAREIGRTGQVSIGRANLIARTEVARASSGLVMARATYLGSDGYIWETSRDSDVRESHRKLSGKFIRWDSPPTTDGLTYHAGQGPNCRCWPRPLIPDEDD